MSPASERARAKVNLFLHLLGRRSDGYHLLDSLAVFPDVGDTLTAELADRTTLEIEGPFAAGLSGDNLVLRAACALRSAGGAALVLEKNLPVASGIGGGSADAAAALRVLDRLWGLDLPQAELAAIALGLGADVPVCLASVPARMGGIGEAIGVAPVLPRCGIVLVNPGVPVSTAEVFRRRTAGFSPPAVLPARWTDAEGAGGRPGRVEQRSGGAGAAPLPADRSGARLAAGAAGVPVRADERVRCDVFRVVRYAGAGGGGREGPGGLVVLGRIDPVIGVYAWLQPGY